MKRQRLPSGRVERLKHISREIEQCEAALRQLDCDSEEIAQIREQLDVAKAQQRRLQQALSCEDADKIEQELAHWAGNLDPLPSPHRLTTHPFGGRGRRR